MGKDTSIDGGEESRTARWARQRGGENGIRTHGAQAPRRVSAFAAHAERLRVSQSDRARGVSRKNPDTDSGAALHDRPLKESFRQWRRDERAHAHAAGGF